MKYWFLIFNILILVSCSTQKKSETGFDSELSGYAYPYPVKTYTLHSQKQVLNFRYSDLGDEKSQKVAVLLHGKNFSGYYWKSIANELLKKNYRVIIPDQIGFGKSSKPKMYQYSFSQLALNTFALLESINVDKFTLVGHSMGGMLATHMASMSKKIDKLILINPIGLEDYLDYVEYKDPEFFYKNEVNKSVDAFRNYQIKNYYDGKWQDTYEELLVPFKGWRVGADWELVAWNNALTYHPIFADPIRDKIRNLRTPLHLILGIRDRTGPGRGWKKPGVVKELGRYDKLGSEVKRLNPKFVKLYELKGLGHMPQFEDYGRFSKVFYPLF